MDAVWCITRIDKQEIDNDGKEEGLFIPSIVIVWLTGLSITSMKNYGMAERFLFFSEYVYSVFDELVIKCQEIIQTRQDLVHWLACSPQDF